jgi:hypothetical protein
MTMGDEVLSPRDIAALVVATVLGVCAVPLVYASINDLISLRSDVAEDALGVLAILVLGGSIVVIGRVLRRV